MQIIILGQQKKKHIKNRTIFCVKLSIQTAYVII